MRKKIWLLIKNKPYKWLLLGALAIIIFIFAIFLANREFTNKIAHAAVCNSLPVPVYSQEIGNGTPPALDKNYIYNNITYYQPITPASDMYVYEIKVMAGNWGGLQPRDITCKITDSANNDISAEVHSETFVNTDGAQWRAINFRNAGFKLEKNKNYRLYCRNGFEQYPSPPNSPTSEKMIYWQYNTAMGLANGKTFIIRYCSCLSCSSSCIYKFSQEEGTSNAFLPDAWNQGYYQTIKAPANMVVHEINVKAANGAGGTYSIACRVMNSTGTTAISSVKISVPFNSNDGLQWRKLDFRDSVFSLQKDTNYRLECRTSGAGFSAIVWGLQGGWEGGKGWNYIIDYCPCLNLDVSLAATPPSGNAPLTGVELKATTSGNVGGSTNYTFYCDRSDSSTKITSDYAYKFDSSNLIIFPATGICDSVYATPGIYSAKIIAERGPFAVSTTTKVTVTDQSPLPVDLSAVEANYCVHPPATILTWRFTDPDPDDTQWAYEVQIQDPDSPTPISSGKQISSSNSFSTQGILTYNKSYQWCVKVWDNHDIPSSCIAGLTITTPKHQYPSVYFNWSPSNPSKNNLTLFSDQTIAYDSGNPAIWNWKWDIPDSQYINGTTFNSQNPKIKFNSDGDKNVTLEFTDSDGYKCSYSLTVPVTDLPLPKWIEK